MLRKGLPTLSRSALIVGALMASASYVSAQVFLGTPTPPQFASHGQPSTKNGEWPSNGGDLSFSRYSPLDQINSPVFASSATTERRVPAVA